MKLIFKYSIADQYSASMYEEKYGYTYRIKARINGKMIEVARSFVYFGRREDCEERMRSDLEQVMNITPLHLGGDNGSTSCVRG